jgi:LysR substrate binding domain-containing protein
MAAAGYIAVAPELLSGMGLHGGRTSDFAQDKVTNVAGSGNHTLTSRLNDFAWACVVLTSFPRAMLIMAGTFGLWRAGLISNALFATGVGAVVLVLLGSTTWPSGGFWASYGAYSRFVSTIIGLVWVVELAASESPTTIIEDSVDLAIHSGDLPDFTLVARRFAQTMTILVATPQYLTRYGAPESPDDLNRFRSVVFVERGSVQPWSFGSGQDAKRVIPTGVFRTSIEQMRMGVLEHLGIAQAPAWLFAAELREGTVIRLLTAFERTVPILAVRPASRRLSTKVRIFIEHLEKTFALCSQFNPRPS